MLCELRASTVCSCPAANNCFTVLGLCQRPGGNLKSKVASEMLTPAIKERMAAARHSYGCLLYEEVLKGNRRSASVIIARLGAKYGLCAGLSMRKANTFLAEH